MDVLIDLKTRFEEKAKQKKTYDVCDDGWHRRLISVIATHLFAW